MNDRFSPYRATRLAPHVLMLLLGMVICLAAIPRHAFAREYSVDGVNIDLTVNADASISVVEERTFDFSGSYNGVYWDIAYGAPDATTNTEGPQLAVTSVEDLTAGGAFSESGAERTGTYQLSDLGGDVTRLKIYAAHEDESATIRIAYTVTNVVNAWRDAGELYWKFVSDGWDVPSDNVTCRVHLPVPAGQSVTAGDNVKAWGHGPLDASLAFDGNDVVYTVPGVGTSEFAEARIVFPVAWLTGATVSGTDHLSTIEGEEQAWADAANAEREQARAWMGAATGVTFALPVVAVVFTLLRFRRYRAAHVPQFQDEYFRDVPSPAHPAVLGCLYNGGSVSNELLTATLMRLTDGKAITLDVVKDSSGREKDYVIRRGGDRPTHGVDRAAMRLLFDVVAPNARGGFVKPGFSAGDAIAFSDIKRAAKEVPQKYADGIEAWSSEVKAACEGKGYFADATKVGRALSAVVFVLLNLVAAAAAIVLFALGGIVLGCLGLVLATASCVVCGVTVAKMKPLSTKGVELTAKLRALRRWLTDFTLLKEAVPRDVILWNRLLVMAVVLGVAERVIAQLRVVAPEILESPGFYDSYWWCHRHGNLGRPTDAFGRACESAHSVSASALASSSNSSGSGFGGGAF